MKATPETARALEAEAREAILRDAALVLVSRMAEGGVIFSDGIESDFLNFNHGFEARIGMARKRGELVV